MAGNGRHSTDARLIVELAKGEAVSTAARAAGLSERTAYRRLASTAFKNRVGAARDELFTRALGRLADSVTDAAETLRGCLTSESESIKLRAAVALLDQAVHYQDSQNLVVRVDAIESFLKAERDAQSHTKQA